MRRFLIPAVAAGAILAACAAPASAAVTQATAPAVPAVKAADAVPSTVTWEWVLKGFYSSHEICYLVGETFKPYKAVCEKYYIGARPGDYEWVLYVYELVES